MVRFGLVALLAIAGLRDQATAQPVTSPITDSNYAIELYDGVPLGSTAVVGMGGATIALAVGTAGTLFNPSAPAVRPTTDKDWWSWDYHLDYLNGSLSNDYDNNGFMNVREDGPAISTGGFGLRFGDWAGALTVTQQTAPVIGAVAMTPNGDVNVEASTWRFQLALAHWLERYDLALGASVQAATFQLEPACDGPGCEALFSVGGAGLELGSTWIPHAQSLRVGATLATPIRGGDVTPCAPGDCDGWILPDAIVTAWRLGLGGAYRFAPTAWNQRVPGYFRDERSLTVATDVILIGSTEMAFGLEAFGQHELQRSGRHPSISVRSGVEYEWLPGRLRVRGGTYWEPSRFVGVSGRLHVTFGLELRVLELWFWDKLRRGRISLTTDVAERYRNGGLSIGFWH